MQDKQALSKQVESKQALVSPKQETSAESVKIIIEKQKGLDPKVLHTCI